MTSRRVIFIDLARALAVVAMLYGHALDALLAPQYRAGLWFTAWTFQRGLTSSLFLLLSGFAFSIATARHWNLHIEPSWAMLRRARRFALFILLGYALHIPVDHWSQFAGMDADHWRSFLAVDVLQLIGVTFFAVQVLVVVARSRRVFMVLSLVAAAALVCATPFVWNVRWETRLPLVIADYLGPSAGSQFPLLPWAGFVLVGAGLGQMYARWGAANLAPYANRALLIPGVVLVAAGELIFSLPSPLFGQGEFSFIPPQFLVRSGSCLLVMGVVAHASARLTRMPHAVAAMAQETLLIYFVHLCIVYGSIWSPGLAQIYGPTLTPGPTALVIVLLVGSMTLLAWSWNWAKHAHARVARVLMLAAWALLAFRLL